jgi:hypothetical protein
MSKKIIVAAAFSLLATAGMASEAAKRNPASHDTAEPTACTCALDKTPAPVMVRKTEKVTAVVVKPPKVQSKSDLQPGDHC